jgi:hypothetical protein
MRFVPKNQPVGSPGAGLEAGLQRYTQFLQLNLLLCLINLILNYTFSSQQPFDS